MTICGSDVFKMRTSTTGEHSHLSVLGVFQMRHLRHPPKLILHRSTMRARKEFHPQDQTANSRPARVHTVQAPPPVPTIGLLRLS